MPKYNFVAVHTWLNKTNGQEINVTYSRNNYITNSTEEQITDEILDGFSENFIAKAKRKIGDNIEFIRRHVEFKKVE